MTLQFFFYCITKFQVDTTILGLDDERAKEQPYIASMGIYVVNKNAMLQLLRDKFPAANDFGSEVIPGATSIGMRVSYASCLIKELLAVRGGVSIAVHWSLGR